MFTPVMDGYRFLIFNTTQDGQTRLLPFPRWPCRAFLKSSSTVVFLIISDVTRATNAQLQDVMIKTQFLKP